MEYIILMDVSGDIAGFEYKDEELGFIPMEYLFNDETIKLDSMKTREELKSFYDYQRKGQLTKTSQISPYLYYGYFEPYLKQGKSILYICLSSGLSSTNQSAIIAKNNLLEKYENLDIEIVDSLGATGGMGILAEKAIKNKRNGKSLKENADEIRNLCKHINYWFLVQNLDYLKRGGRVSATAAMVGNLLNIHPILHITDEGKLETIDKKRGLKLAVKGLIELFKNNYDETADAPIYICDSDDINISDLIEEEVRILYPNADIRRVVLSPVIGSHTGPGFGAIIHVSK